MNKQIVSQTIRNPMEKVPIETPILFNNHSQKKTKTEEELKACKGIEESQKNRRTKA